MVGRWNRTSKPPVPIGSNLSQLLWAVGGSSEPVLEKSAFPICDVHQLPGVLEELELQLAISGKAARVSFIVRRNVAGEIGE